MKEQEALRFIELINQLIEVVPEVERFDFRHKEKVQEGLQELLKVVEQLRPRRSILRIGGNRGN